MAECTIFGCVTKAVKEVYIQSVGRTPPQQDGGRWYPYRAPCVEAYETQWKRELCWGDVRDLEEKPAPRPIVTTSIYQDPPQAYINPLKNPLQYAVAEMHKATMARLDAMRVCASCNGKGTIRKPLFNTMYDEPCGDCSGV